MKSKSKLILSLSSLMVVVGGSLGLTFGVLAAQQQAVRNEFRLSYVADNVSAIVSASYQTKQGQKTNFTNGQQNQIVFDPVDESTTGVLTADNITLTSTDNYVVFTYSYTNTASVGGRYLAVEFVNDLIERTNLVTTYYCSSSDEETYSTITTNGYSTFASIPQKTVYIAPQESFYFYIIEEIDDPTIDAGFSATSNDIEWQLSMILESSVPSTWLDYVESMQGIWTGTEAEETNALGVKIASESEANITLSASYKSPNSEVVNFVNSADSSSTTLSSKTQTLKTPDNSYNELLLTEDYLIVAYRITNNEANYFASISASDEINESNLLGDGAFYYRHKTYVESNVVDYTNSNKDWNKGGKFLIAPGETGYIYLKLYLNSQAKTGTIDLDHMLTISSTKVPATSTTDFVGMSETGKNHKFATVSANYEQNGSVSDFLYDNDTEISFYDTENTYLIQDRNLTVLSPTLNKTKTYALYKFRIKNENLTNGYYLNIWSNGVPVLYESNSSVEVLSYMYISSDGNLTASDVRNSGDTPSAISDVYVAGQETIYIYQLIELNSSTLSNAPNSNYLAVCYVNEDAYIVLEQNLIRFEQKNTQTSLETSVTISGSYSLGNGETGTLRNYNGATEVTSYVTRAQSAEGSHASLNAHLTGNAVYLTSTNQYALYKLAFTNNGDTDVVATLENNCFGGPSLPYTRTFFASDSSNLDYQTVLSSGDTEQITLVDGDTISSLYGYSINIPANQTKYFYVAITRVEDCVFTINDSIIYFENTYNSSIDVGGHTELVTFAESYTCENATTETFMDDAGQTSISQNSATDYDVFAPEVTLDSVNTYALYKTTITTDQLSASVRFRHIYYTGSFNNNVSGISLYYLISDNGSLTASDLITSGTEVSSLGQSVEYDDLIDTTANVAAGQTIYVYELIKNTSGETRVFNTNGIMFVFEEGSGSVTPTPSDTSEELVYDSTNDYYTVEIDSTTYTLDDLAEVMIIDGNKYFITGYASVGGDDYEIFYDSTQNAYGTEVGGQVYYPSNCTFGDQSVTIENVGTFDMTYKLTSNATRAANVSEQTLTYDSNNSYYTIEIDGQTYNLSTLSEVVKINGRNYQVKAYTSVMGDDYAVFYDRTEGAYGTVVGGDTYYGQNFTFGDQTVTVQPGTFGMTYKLVLETNS